MGEINIKALFYTIIVLIITPLIMYIIFTNTVVLCIVGIILSIIIIIAVFYGLYIFFDECF